MRSAISRFRNLLAGAAALICSLAAPPLLAEDTLSLGLGQAREMAVQALKAGDPGLAIALARGLIKADPQDFVAHYVLASAEAGLNRPDASRKAAAQAFKYADTPTARFRSAQLAARMAYAQDRYSLSQLWLRRAAIHAPDDGAEDAVARDYRLLRRINPWSVRLQVDVRPSSNVNKGADSALQIIDGVPVTGYLGGSAQALSGLITSVDLYSAYRIDSTDRSSTSVLGRVYMQRVALSAEAKDQAPDASGSDFGTTFAEAGLRHIWQTGPRGAASAAVTLGEAWAAGERSFRFARLNADHGWNLGRGHRVELSALTESRYMARYATNDARVWGLGASWTKRLTNGDRLDVTLAWRDTDAQHPNGTYTSASLRTEYELGRPVGPVTLSGAVILGYTDYPDFVSGGFIQVPGGRQDESIYGEINMMFQDVDFAGFVPMLRLRAGEKDSNDSRYSMKEFTLSVGFRSKF